DFAAPAGFRDRHLRNDPGMRRGAEGKRIGANAVTDRAGVATAEAERKARDAVGDAGLEDNRRLHPKAVGGEGDDIPGREAKPLCILRIERKRIAPYLFRQWIWAFLQPRVVGEAAVPQAGVGAQHDCHRSAWHYHSGDVWKLRLSWRYERRRACGDDAVVQRPRPPLLEVALGFRSPRLPHQV